MTESNNKIKSGQHFYCDLSFWALVVSNLVVIVWALIEQWPLDLMIWVYFSQNVIMGFFWPAKVFSLPTDGSYTKKVQSVAVFLPHYLTMHFVYGLFLYNFLGKELFTNYKYILTMAGIFFLSELVSHFAGSRLNRTKPLSLAKVQFFPYARVIPMHFAIIFGFFFKAGVTISSSTVMLFLLLKAFADVAMYMVERSRVFGSSVIDMFEWQRKSGGFDVYSSSTETQAIYRKDKQEVCRFCQRAIGRNETPWVIKENVVCEKCYNRIEKEKGKID